MAPSKGQLNLKNITVNLSGVIAVLLLEYALIESFISIGLVDPAPLEIHLGGNLPSIYVSIIFHLIPLNVTLILMLSWIHLNKIISEGKRTYKPVRRGGKSKSSAKTLHSSELIPKEIPGVIILFSFLLFVLFMSVCPYALYNLVLNLYWGNDLFRALIEWSSQINSSLIDAVGLFAASLRGGISSLIRPLSDPLLEVDVVWKYLICQNAAAWLTTMFTLAYGKYYGGRGGGWR